MLCPRHVKRSALTGRLLACLPAIFLLSGMGPHVVIIPVTSRAFLSRAIQNVHTARSYIEESTSQTTTPGKTVVQMAREQYDERHNNEHDIARVTVRIRDKAGHAHTTRYTIEVIMAKRHTYVRRSDAGMRRQVYPGFGYTDSLSDTRWIRSSLNFTLLKRLTISRVILDRGQKVYLLNATLPHGGSLNFTTIVLGLQTPFIVFYWESEIQPGQHFQATESTHLGYFNAAVDIGPPRLP